MSEQQIIGLSMMIIGLILMFIFGFLTYNINKKNKIHNNFYRANKESSSLWEFTKKNYPIFLTLFSFVLAFSGFMMLFQ